MRSSSFSPGPDTADGIEKLNVVVDVKNTGDSPLKLLNDPNGPLSKMPTNTFSITDESGSNPAFVGVKVGSLPSQLHDPCSHSVGQICP